MAFSNGILGLYSALLPAVVLIVQQLLSATLPKLPYQYGNTQVMDTYDFIVVGSGAGGSVVAGRLSETGVRVLLLEDGPNATPDTAVPALNGLNAGTQRIWTYEGAMRITTPRVVGGGTTINGLVWVRGNRRDYDGWEKLGNPGWDYKSVLPYFKKTEDYHGLMTSYTNQSRGFGGPIRIEEGYRLFDFVKAFARATLELGFNVIDETGPSQIGISPVHGNTKDGMRVSASEAYVRPNIDRPTFDVLPEALVTRVIFNSHKEAVGVEFEHKGMKRTAKAAKEVIISAGTLSTPKLLMLSGVGPEDQLRKHGIPIVHVLPGVGKNLQDHPYVTTIYKVREGTSMVPQDLVDVKEVFRYLKDQTGSLSKNPWLMSNSWFNVNGGDVEWPDVQLVFYTMGGSNDGGAQYNRLFGLNLETVESAFGPYNGIETITLESMLSRCKSRGEVTLKSNDPKDHPLVDPNYYADKEDLKTIVKGLRVIHKFVATKAIQNHFQPHYLPVLFAPCASHGNDTDTYWECYTQYLTNTGRHYVGTSKMAPASDPMAVVDHRLRVYGVSNLRVVDASIMPQIIASNTMSTTIMIGEKAADMIKEDFTLHI